MSSESFEDLALHAGSGNIGTEGSGFGGGSGSEDDGLLAMEGGQQSLAPVHRTSGYQDFSSIVGDDTARQAQSSGYTSASAHSDDTSLLAELAGMAINEEPGPAFYKVTQVKHRFAGKAGLAWYLTKMGLSFMIPFGASILFIKPAIAVAEGVPWKEVVYPVSGFSTNFLGYMHYALTILFINHLTDPERAAIHFRHIRDSAARAKAVTKHKISSSAKDFGRFLAPGFVGASVMTFSYLHSNYGKSADWMTDGGAVLTQLSNLYLYTYSVSQTMWYGLGSQALDLARKYHYNSDKRAAYRAYYQLRQGYEQFLQFTAEDLAKHGSHEALDNRLHYLDSHLPTHYTNAQRFQALIDHAQTRLAAMQQPYLPPRDATFIDSITGANSKRDNVIWWVSRIAGASPFMFVVLAGTLGYLYDAEVVTNYLLDLGRITYEPTRILIQAIYYPFSVGILETLLGSFGWNTGSLLVTLVLDLIVRGKQAELPALLRLFSFKSPAPYALLGMASLSIFSGATSQQLIREIPTGHPVLGFITASEAMKTFTEYCAFGFIPVANGYVLLQTAKFIVEYLAVHMGCVDPNKRAHMQLQRNIARHLKMVLPQLTPRQFLTELRNLGDTVLRVIFPTINNVDQLVDRALAMYPEETPNEMTGLLASQSAAAGRHQFGAFADPGGRRPATTEDVIYQVAERADHTSGEQDSHDFY